MKRLKRSNLFKLLIFFIMLSYSGCNYYVTRYQGEQLKARLRRVSELLSERRQQARELQQAVIKAKRELEEVRKARERYRKEQTQFLEEAQSKLQNIQSRINDLETKLRDLSSKVDGDLKTSLDDTEKVLKQRGEELNQLEIALQALIDQIEPTGLDDLLIVIDSLGKAKQWKVMIRYIQLVKIKATKLGKSEYYGKALYTGAYESYQSKEYPKSIVLSKAYERSFPEGHELPDIYLIMAYSQYALENCTPAINILTRFINKFPNHEKVQEAKQLRDTIKKQLHSSKYCEK